MPPWLICDPYMLKEILSNLIDNSIKHCPSGVIQLRAFVDDGQPSLVVEDTGPGIPPDQLEKIFEAFFQAGEKGVNQQGVGLGLAICKTLTERLAGTITASNCDTGGARFTVKFPASAASAGTQEPGKIQRFDQSETPESATSRKPHFTLRQARGSILVVDDLPFVGHTLTRILTQAGCDSQYASPFDAMSICRAGSFDEALVDLNMQGQDGFEIARQLRDLYGNAIRIHAMSESDYLLSLAQDSALFDSATSKTTLFRAPEKEEKKDPSL
jgi:CheY-like chemotaxis protein/anti-sigma regulatory factor (Ser/Thr protein kinase)